MSVALDFTNSGFGIWRTWKAWALEVFGSIGASIFEKAEWWTDEGVGVGGQDPRHVWLFYVGCNFQVFDILSSFWSRHGYSFIVVSFRDGIVMAGKENFNISLIVSDFKEVSGLPQVTFLLEMFILGMLLLFLVISL